MNNKDIWAFPSHGSMGEVAQEGMTLRDYFAAKAMQGMCAGLKSGDKVEHLPAFAYLMADAMLAARSNT